MNGRTGEPRFDTHKEKAADDRDFAQSRAAHEAATADVPRSPMREWQEQPYPPKGAHHSDVVLKSGRKGENTANHPGRGVPREKFSHLEAHVGPWPQRSNPLTGADRNR